MDLSKIKSEIIKKFSENKTYLSKFDFWSFVDDVNYFSFKTSQIGFRYIKGDKSLNIIEERVSSGRLAVILKFEPVKLDEFIFDKVEIIQDIEIKTNDLTFISSSYSLKEAFNTRNAMKTKELKIFDVKAQGKILVMKIESNTTEHIELTAMF
jgi:hypothetical protein